MKLVMPTQQLDTDDFNDGAQRIIPNDTICIVGVTDAYCGTPEGKATSECWISLKILSGEFAGQKYRYTAKVFDVDASKRDRAISHLTTIDSSVNFPLARNGLDLSTDNMKNHWSSKAKLRVKIGLLSSPDRGEMNFIKGFALLPQLQQVPPQQAPQHNQMQHEQPQYQAPQQSYEGNEGF